MIKVQTHTHKFPIIAYVSFWSPRVSTQTGLHPQARSLCLWWANVGFSIAIASPPLSLSWGLGVPRHPHHSRRLCRGSPIHGAMVPEAVCAPGAKKLPRSPCLHALLPGWESGSSPGPRCCASQGRSIAQAGTNLSLGLHLQGLALDHAWHMLESSCLCEAKQEK